MDVSIVIPTYNRKDSVLKTLEALRAVDYPHDCWEAVVMDDGSTDGTKEAICAWIGATQAPVRYVWQQNSGRSRARNRGADEARGKLLIFIDNDIIVPPDFIRLHLETHAAHPNSWVVGKIIQAPELRRTPFGRYRAELIDRTYSGLPDDRISETEAMTTQNVSMPIEHFRELGGFDPSLTGPEDWELSWRARQRGARLLYNPQLQVLHDDWAISLDSYCERERDYESTQVLLYRKWGEASPWARLYLESAPVRWGQDSPRLIAKKALKYALAAAPARRVVHGAAWVMERIAPNSRWSYRAYEAAIGIAIFCGVQQGVKRHGAC